MWAGSRGCEALSNTPTQEPSGAGALRCARYCLAHPDSSLLCVLSSVQEWGQGEVSGSTVAYSRGLQRAQRAARGHDGLHPLPSPYQLYLCSPLCLLADASCPLGVHLGRRNEKGTLEDGAVQGPMLERGTQVGAWPQVPPQLAPPQAQRACSGSWHSPRPSSFSPHPRDVGENKTMNQWEPVFLQPKAGTMPSGQGGCPAWGWGKRRDWASLPP